MAQPTTHRPCRHIWEAPPRRAGAIAPARAARHRTLTRVSSAARTRGAKGLKAGGFPNGTAATDLGFSPVRQESVLTYEAGVKSQFLDHKLMINAAAFYSDYKDKQIKSKLFDPIFQYLLALVNVPRSQILGAEVELAAHPLTGLTVGASAVFLDTELINTLGPDSKYPVTNANLQANFLC